jgi:hypothetical protein
MEVEPTRRSTQPPRPRPVEGKQETRPEPTEVKEQPREERVQRPSEGERRLIAKA